MYRPHVHAVLRLACCLLLLLSLALASLPANDKPAPKPKPSTPSATPAFDEAAKVIKRFRLPAGVEASVWAAEPLLANPVAFSFDEKGRCYVAETFRLHRGVTDNRGHMDWLDDDLASRTVADRVALYRKSAKDKFAEWYETESERVKLVWDSTGAGKADKAAVFAEGFRHAADGLGAGVLARKGDVYYTCIPDLWLLKDTKGEGTADVKKSLATGFGVHVAFIGHDMHGLRMGPDGRLYFSLGDRGLNVTTREGVKLFNPDSGAVLRCDPDGSNLEIVATGLRNPQELAFDQYGNLFTVDNNSDSSDRARVVYIVEGGDSGWRTGYQYGSSMSDRGPFNAEKIWHLPPAEQPAYIVPPLAHITSGPSGLCFNYGATALPERYKDHFFICDFHGSANGSGVFSFAVKPKGAAFEVTDGHQAVWNILATDCDFGPDGGLYVSDWVDGWDLTGKGRIYRFADPEAAKRPEVAEVKKLLAEGFDKRPTEELAKLLGHADMRVRQEAQFALAAKGKEAVPTLARSASEGANRLARLHAVWGLGQVGRTDAQAVREPLRALLKDDDAEVRAQAARALGWVKGSEARDLVPLLKDPEPRVRFQAMTSLAKPATPHFADGDSDKVWNAVVELLKDNADRDAYLRHAASRVMAGYSGQELVNCTKHESPSVRLAAVLALRHRNSPVVWPFLDDPDPKIATEAARVLHDVVLDPSGVAGTPLAERLNTPGRTDFFLWRALNANFRLGEAENARAVARFAASAAAPEKLRAEAVKMLGAWANPGRRDRVTGLTQDLRGQRDAKVAAEALRESLGGIFSGPAAVRKEAARAAGQLGIKGVGPTLLALVADRKGAVTPRVEALGALLSLKDDRLEEAMRQALADADSRLRTAGRRVLAVLKADEAVASLRDALQQGDLVEKQGAVQILGEMKSPASEALLGEWLTKLLAKEVPAELQLDVLEAAARRGTAVLKEKLAQFEAARAKNDHLARYSEALVGGDAESGRRIFFGRAEVSCLRCHKVNGEGGDVGPDLSKIGSQQKRAYLLESIVEPNRQIAKGFDSVVLTLTSGKSVTGIVKAENDKEIRLMTAEGQVVTVAKSNIEERQAGKSAMPEDLVQKLSKRDLRDLVEFLAGLK
jgi:quinoprotein glucose dehydrogenase